MEDAFRKRMQEIVDHQAMSPKSLVLSPEKYEAIYTHLMNKGEKVDPHFKHWVKTRQFQLVNLPDLGLQNAICVPNGNKNHLNLEGSSKFLQVIHSGDVFDVVRGIHEDELKHGGYKKVMDYVQRHYFGITRKFIQEFCKHCPICQVNQQQQATRPQPRCLKFLERVQVDLIDMSHSPDGEFGYIGHFIDLFSKFRVLFPLRGNTADEVALMLEERVMAYVGPPRIFHSNYGSEFVNQLIEAMVSRWKGDSTFVNGHLQQAQFQYMLEEGTQMVLEKIAVIKQEENIEDEDSLGCPWASWLPRIMFSMNSYWNGTFQYTPYRIVFGRNVPDCLLSGSKMPYVYEEDQNGYNEDGITSAPQYVLSNTLDGELSMHGLHTASSPQTDGNRGTQILSPDDLDTANESQLVPACRKRKQPFPVRLEHTPPLPSQSPLSQVPPQTQSHFVE